MNINIEYTKEQMVELLNSELKKVSPNSPNITADKISLRGVSGKKKMLIDKIELSVDMPH